jgi:hypothetical protein
LPQGEQTELSGDGQTRSILILFSIWHSNDIAGGIKTRVKKGVNSAKISLTAQKLTAFFKRKRAN